MNNIKNIFWGTLYIGGSIIAVLFGVISMQGIAMILQSNNNIPNILGLVSTGVTVIEPPVCGNGIIESTEECDGTSLNGNTCISNGFVGGSISCNSNCTLNVAGCITSSVYCGDGVINYSEECDTSDFGTKQCSTFGYDLGDLVCNSNCTINKLKCEYLIVSPTIFDDKLKITPTLINNHYVRPTTGLNSLVTKLPDTGGEKNVKVNSFNIKRYINNPIIYVPVSFVIVIVSKWYWGIHKKKK